MSKEEILAQQLDRYLLKISHVERGCEPIPVSIYRAMDQYAEQESISFAEWIGSHGYQHVSYPDKESGWTNTEHYGSTEELYQLYKKETQQTKTT